MGKIKETGTYQLKHDDGTVDQFYYRKGHELPDEELDGLELMEAAKEPQAGAPEVRSGRTVKLGGDAPADIPRPVEKKDE